MAECVIFVGLQGSGKTTFFRERFAETHHHVSKDNFPNARNRDDRQRRMIAEALAVDQSIVVDNTNPTRADRTPIIAVAREAGATVTGYFFDVPVRVALVRNRRRDSRGRVPDVALFTTKKKLEPPTPDEGFDRLYRVTTGEAGELAIAAM